MSDCFHCGLPVPTGAHFQSTVAGAERSFCCPGCQAVATAIDAGGLSGFYQYRTQKSEKPELSGRDFSVYDQPEVQTEFVAASTEGGQQASLLLGGITCAACVWLVEHHLQQLDGVVKVSVNANTHRCQVVWHPDQLPLSRIMTALADIGYHPQPATEDRQHQLHQQEQRQTLMRLAVAGFGMMQVSMFAVALYAGALQGISDLWQQMFRLVSFAVATPVVFFSARTFFVGAIRSLKSRHLTMDVPVALAIGGAYLASVWATLMGGGEVYFDSVSMFTFFLLLGRYLEMRARHRNSLATGRLAQLIPLTVLRWDDSQQAYLPAVSKYLRIGDRLLVGAGETIPCDGVVEDGASGVDESLLTGESQPLHKQAGDTVTAGTLNTDSPLQISVTAVGAATRLSAIEQLVEQAQAEKPRQVAVADRLSGYFVGTVLVTAVAVYSAWLFIDPDEAFWVTLSVLVVTCPCALSLASPAALTAAVSEMRSRGLLITRGHVLETLPTIDRVIFDKTGTLTVGEPQLVDVQLLAHQSRDDVLQIAAALEAGSSHPLARAFESVQTRLQAVRRRQVAGQGVEGEVGGVIYRLGRPSFVSLVGDTGQQGAALEYPADADGQWLLLADSQQPLAWICLNDDLRRSASGAVSALQQRGLGVELLTGDSSAAGQKLAATLGITHIQSGMSPADKLHRLTILQQDQHKVLMVGDGINDVPVLSRADVSVAMGSATDLAQTRADSILLNGDLNVLNQAIDCAHLTRRIIRQNLAWALLYNGSALPLAAMGLIPPYLAAIGMSLSSLIVVGNALRIHRRREPVYTPA